MHLEKVNQWLTIFANVGVLLGILFLAIELQQNTEMMKAQTRDSVTDKLANWFMDIGTDPGASQIMASASQGYPDLSTGEGISYLFMVQTNFRLWENEWYQYEKGLFEEDEFQARRKSWEGVMPVGGYQSVWLRTRDQYAPRFREQIDQIVGEIGN